MKVMRTVFISFLDGLPLSNHVVEVAIYKASFAIPTGKRVIM